jgi:anti-sigma factor RsiW
MVPLGMAAALLVAAGMWRHWPWSEPRLSVVSVVPGRVVADVREQHRYCVSHRGGNHNDVSLPRDLQIIAERLSARLSMDVIAPDLSAFGFELVGADSCGLMGRPGAHVLYQSVSTGRMLSLFTVNRLASLGPESGEGAVDGALLVSSEGSPSVVAWHDGPQTYLVCAEVPEATLLEIGGRVSTASAVQPGMWGGPQPVLAVVAGK